MTDFVRLWRRPLIVSTVAFCPADRRWLRQYFWAPLGEAVIDTLSSPAAERLAEVEPEAYYTTVGYDGNPLRIPADLDESLCRYRELSDANRSKFDRAAFWLDVARRQWTMSVSASFASLVSAVEPLTDRGTTHRVYCKQCQDYRPHEVPGAIERFRSFFETYAPGAAERKRRSQMYDLRSGILHGSNLMLLDQDLYFGWDPPGSNELDQNNELSSITRLALRNWLKNPAPDCAPEEPKPRPVCACPVLDKLFDAIGHLRGQAKRVCERLFAP
jgi:hypothetical protein